MTRKCTHLKVNIKIWGLSFYLFFYNDDDEDKNEVNPHSHIDQDFKLNLKWWIQYLKTADDIESVTSLDLTDLLDQPKFSVFNYELHGNLIIISFC